MAHKIGIISIKGGVGKTSMVGALGASLAQDYDKRVLIVDANFSAPNLGLHFGLINPKVTLHHVLNNQANIKQAVYESSEGFHIIPGALIHGKINPFKLKVKLKELDNLYDYILIDSSPSLNDEILATMIASDELYVVTTPDHVTLSTTLRAVKLAKEKKTFIRGIILNKVHDRDFELTSDQIEDAAGIDVLAVLPHELDMLKALAERSTISNYKRTEVSKEISKLAASIVGEDYKPTFLERLKRFFTKRSKQDINRDILFEQTINNSVY